MTPEQMLAEFQRMQPEAKETVLDGILLNYSLGDIVQSILRESGEGGVTDVLDALKAEIDALLKAAEPVRHNAPPLVEWSTMEAWGRSCANEEKAP